MTAAEPAEMSPEEKRARNAWEQGEREYTVGNYEQAALYFEAAYDAMREAHMGPKPVSRVLYALARAHRRWYDIDKDIAHLRRASSMLETAAGLGDKVVAEGGTSDVDDMRREQAEVDKQIADIERADAPAGPVETKQTRIMKITGFSLIGVGAGAGIGTIVTGVLAQRTESEITENPGELDKRKDRLDRGRTLNITTIALGTVAGVLIAAGVGLVVTGYVKERKGDDRQTARVRPTLGGLEVVF